MLTIIVALWLYIVYLVMKTSRYAQRSTVIILAMFSAGVNFNIVAPKEKGRPEYGLPKLTFDDAR